MNATPTTPTFAWSNGALVPWADATIHARTDGFMRAASVFEGIRAYVGDDRDQLYLFRMEEHLHRLYDVSMKLMRMELEWSPVDLTDAIVELLKANDVRADTHVRPQVYFGGDISHPLDSSSAVGCVITAVEWPTSGTVEHGVAARVSSWRRIDDMAMPPRVKAAGNYLNSRYAQVEAKQDGYDTAILLNGTGKVTEGPGNCLAMMARGRLITPPVTSGTLDSITRQSLLELASDRLGLEVDEREIDRTELYLADELLLCGTGHEIEPVTSLDRFQIGSGRRGPVCEALQTAYYAAARGEDSRYKTWLLPVY